MFLWVAKSASTVKSKLKKNLKPQAGFLLHWSIASLLLAAPSVAVAAPVINGIFYGDGDDAQYVEIATSNFGSKLYAYYNVQTTELSVALVVAREVNDNVFTNYNKQGNGGDTGDYMASADWGGGGGQQRGADVLVDSEFAAFTLECAPGSPQSWTWQQSYAYNTVAEDSTSNWQSDEAGGAGSGTAPPNMESYSSFVYNINNYPFVSPLIPLDDNPDPWNMFYWGSTLDKWKSPYSASNADRNDITLLTGYPSTGQITYFPYNSGDLWEWPMVYEWQVNLTNIGCGTEAVYFVTGLSHHSPAKNEILGPPENDDFPPISDPPILSDFGDLPDTYGTEKTLTDGNPSPTGFAQHYIKATGNVYLGSELDVETDGNPDTAAAGDNNSGIDDEDGVTPVTSNGIWTEANPNHSFEVVTSGAGELEFWLDWNRDGVFDASEYQAVTISGTTTTVNVVVPSGSGFDSTIHDLAARFRIYSSTSTAPNGLLSDSNYVGVATDGEVEDYIWGNGGVGTLPVTVAYVQASHKGNQLSVEWSTATETSNIGFNIYAVVLGQWTKLNDAPIPGSLDSLVPQNYKKMVSNPFGDSLTEIGIGGVDVNGKEDRHGPFTVNEIWGERPTAAKIDWSLVRSEMKKSMSKRKAHPGSAVHMDVADDGLYKATDAELQAIGFNLKGVKASHIAVSFRGEAVARHIGGLDKHGRWGSNSWVEFLGTAPADRDAIYLNANRYQLSRDISLVKNSNAFELPETGSVTFEENNKYAFTNSGDDPWYDVHISARPGSQGFLSRSFDLDGLQEGDAELVVNLSALSSGGHHLLIDLNGIQIADEQTSGWTPWEINIPVTGLLKETGNKLSLTLVGDASNFDYVLFDKFEVTFTNNLQAETRSAKLELAENVKRTLLSRGSADLLVISHPALMGEALDEYIEQLGSNGWETKLVDVFDLYQAYGFGMATPSAIVDYLADAKTMGYTHVQLVGAASADYRDFLGIGSVSFIPSIYKHTSQIINYTPCDSCMVMDDSEVPFAAIGRFPVRTVAELQAVVNKGKTWAAGFAAEHSILLVADRNDGENDFVSQLEQATQQLLQTAGWNEPARVYLDEAIAAAGGDENAGVSAAKAALIAELELGASITFYSGHGGPTVWSYEGQRLLKQDDIAAIQNIGKPTLALPLTCYTTYAESPYTTSMAHQLIAAGQNGAVAVYGAASLSSYQGNSVIAKEVLDGLLSEQTLGESILNAKRNAGSNYRDIIINSNLLGDVSLRIH